MNRRRSLAWLLLITAVLSAAATARGQSHENAAAALRVRIESSLPGPHHAVPAVIWLDPVAGTSVPPFAPRGHYTLVQKNRTFIPHLQVIPVGSVVQFPNEDPFFHNVFSLFDGKRFNLGLYEAGSSKSVTFSRIGVSYIFCNIHPEMSAVILAIATPLYTIADSHGLFLLRGVPEGDYTLHVWVEGVPQSFLSHMSRSVHVPAHDVDLGAIKAPIAPAGIPHDNLYGNPYPPETPAPY